MKRVRSNPVQLDPASLKLNQDDSSEAFLAEWQLFRQLTPLLKEALKANDIRTAKKVTAMPALLGMINMAFNSADEKVKLSALKELLAISGHGPVQKSAIGIGSLDGMTEAERLARITSLLNQGTSETEETEDRSEDTTEPK